MVYKKTTATAGKKNKKENAHSDNNSSDSETTAPNRLFGTKITLTGRFNHHCPRDNNGGCRKEFVLNEVIGKKEFICKTHMVFCSACGKHHLKGQQCGGCIAIQKGKLAKQNEEEKRARKTKEREDKKNGLKKQDFKVRKGRQRKDSFEKDHPTQAYISHDFNK